MEVKIAKHETGSKSTGFGVFSFAVLPDAYIIPYSHLFESKHLQGCQVVLYSQLRLIYAKLIYDDIEIHFDVPSVKSIETMAQSK